MSELFHEAHPLVSDAVFFGAVAVIVLVVVYVFTHDEDAK